MSEGGSMNVTWCW